jgi:putative DNA primase/helicase
MKRRDRDSDELLELRRKAKRWAEDNIGKLRVAEPAIPNALNDRASDNWEPLLAIADLADKGWPKLARTAAIKLSADAEAEAQSNKVRLLADIRAVFEAVGVDRLSSAALVAELIKDADGPWAVYGPRSSKPITQRQVARLLDDFLIKPKSMRIAGLSGTPKGYELEMFADAFARYLPSRGEPQTGTPQQTSDSKGLGVANPENAPETQSATSAGNPQHVAVEDGHNSFENQQCCGVADRDPFQGEEEDRTCVQCRGPVDGQERNTTIDGRAIWLHPQCDRFYRQGLAW